MLLFQLIFLPLRLLYCIWLKINLLSLKKDTLLHHIPDKFSILETGGWLNFLTNKQDHSFFEYLAILDSIEKDHKIKEVIYTIPHIKADWHQVEQIGTALSKIRKSGKKLTSHTEGGGIKTLYLVSLAQKRYSSENANFLILLPTIESYFFKQLLNRFGIYVESNTAGRYKGGGFESFTRSNYSSHHKSSMKTLLQELRKEIQKQFESTPNIGKINLKKTLNLIKNQALIEAGELETSGFIHLRTSLHSLSFPSKKEKNTVSHLFNYKGNFSQKKRQIKKPATLKQEKPKKFLSDNNILYRKKVREFSLLRFHKIPTIAFVAMQGNIVMGRKKEEAKSNSISALAYQKIFKDILENPKEEAVFLYINSPGGSADASEILFESIYRLSRIKPVFAFIGSVAASGGYYIACAANRIYASPFALTGSIGVIRIRPDFQKLYAKLGIQKESILEDPTRDIFSEAKKPSKLSQKFLEKSLQNTYHLFLDRVSLGREQNKKEVLKMAEGRVFTGGQFQEKGMVDSSFNFLEALEEYKKVTGKSEKQKYNLQVYPNIKLNLNTILKDNFSFKNKKNRNFLAPLPIPQNINYLLENNKENLLYMIEESAFQNI